MAKKKPYAKNVFRDNYYKRQTSVIANTEVDYDRLRERPLTPEQVSFIKKKYSIEDYASKGDFDIHYAKTARTAIITEIRKMDMTFSSNQEREQYIDRQVQERLTKQWNFYQHRELLIESGQYDEIRSAQYKEYYLKHLRLANADYDIIKNIEDLSIEDFNRLVTFPNADPQDYRIRELPHIKDIYGYQDHDESKNATVRSEIMEAFKSAKIEFKKIDTDSDPDMIKRNNFKKLASLINSNKIKLTYNKNNQSYDIENIGNTKRDKIAKDLWEYYKEHYK